MPVLQVKVSTQRSTVYLAGYSDMVKNFVERYSVELGETPGAQTTTTTESTAPEAQN